MQESAPLRDGHITRVETLGGKYLYAINVYPGRRLVRSLPGRRLPDDGRRASSSRAACAVDAPKTGLRVEGLHAAARRSSRRSSASRARVGLDIGGIEYLVDDRDGKHYFYDINALSNFVADAPNVIGFDPWRGSSTISSATLQADARCARARESRRARRVAVRMRYGYWLPVFGGWLRNVDDERHGRDRGST